MNDEAEPTPSRSQLRDEASEWFAIMRGPDADVRRPEFNAWLALRPENIGAYNSVAETFNVGKLLKDPSPDLSVHEEPNGRSAPPARSPSPRKIAISLLVAAGISAAAIGFAINPARHTESGGSSSSISADIGSGTETRYATNVGEIRNFALSDGSRLALDTNSVVLASYTPAERGLRLMNGRARFYVAREKRPFVVRADTTVVRARQTVFDVTLLPTRRVAVNLVEGALDVQSQPDAPTASSGPARPIPAVFTRMAAGDQLYFDAERGAPLHSSQAGNENWPEGVEAFNDVPLSRVIDAANRYARKPISVETPQIGARHISGTFHLQETRQVAEKIADFLRLAVTYEAGGYVLRQRCAENSIVRCRPPS